MLERQFQKQVVQFLRRRNALVFNLIGNAFQRDLPDLYVAHRFWTGWLELKCDNYQPTKAQLSILAQLRKHGVKAYLFRCKDNQYTLSSPAGDWTQTFDTLESWWEGMTGE